MYSEINANKRKTVFVFAMFFLLVGALSFLLALFLGNKYITPYVLIGAGAYAIISYYSASKMSLAVNGARQIEKRDNPRLYRIVENLSITEGMPTPKVYVMEDASLNAFATGRNPRVAAVCATTGLLDALNDKELEGVMAHELGHVKNYDIRVAMTAFAMVAAISLIADIMLRASWFKDNDDNSSAGQIFFVLGIIAAVLAPLVALLIQMAISRKREYLADATGALTTRYPEGLASALEKIKRQGSVLKKQNTSTAHFFFANPLNKGSLVNLFSTHPPIDERIKRLKTMGSHQ